MDTGLGSDPLLRRFVDSPIGPLRLLAGPAGLRAVLWPGEENRRAWPVRDDGSSRESGEAVRSARAHLEVAARELAEYFAGGRREFDLVLDPVGTPFQLRAWAVLRTIPFASTMSYGEQARALGDANLARAVGGANSRNPISIVVPCHRVVSSNGDLTGFAGGLEVKAWLLRHEREVAGALERVPAGRGDRARWVARRACRLPVGDPPGGQAGSNERAGPGRGAPRGQLASSAGIRRAHPGEDEDPADPPRGGQGSQGGLGCLPVGARTTADLRGGSGPVGDGVEDRGEAGARSMPFG